MTRGRRRLTVMAVVAGCAALAAVLVAVRVVDAGQVPVAGPAHPMPDRAGKILSPCAMTAVGGYLYIAGPDQGSSQVWRISTQTGARVLVAGRRRVFGSAPEGSSAVASPLTTVCGVAADTRGNLVISDGDTYWQYTGEYDSPLMSKGDNRVRVVAARSGTYYGVAMRAGDIYTIAGDGRRGFSGDGGPALDAELDGPAAVAVDQAGNVVLADMINQRIRLIAARSGIFYGQPMRAGDIYTIAGGARPVPVPSGLPPWLGGLATRAAFLLSEPATAPYLYSTLLVDHDGNVVLADTDEGMLLVIAARSGTWYGQAMTAGHLYRIAGNTTAPNDHGAGAGQRATRAPVWMPSGLAIDQAGNVLFADGFFPRVIAVRTGSFYGQAMTTGHEYVLRGLPPPAWHPSLRMPVIGKAASVAIDQAGNVVESTLNQVWVLDERAGRYYGQVMTPGHLYRIDRNPSRVRSGG